MNRYTITLGKVTVVAEEEAPETVSERFAKGFEAHSPAWAREFRLKRGGPNQDDYPEVSVQTCMKCGSLILTGFKMIHERRCWYDR